MSEAKLRDELVRLSRSLFERGFSVGTAGNISIALPDGFLITPTNSCLGFLNPELISKLDAEWRHVGGDAPSKEVPLHRAFYETRRGTGAVVHLHSTYATAYSCLTDLKAEDCIPPLTPYLLMRVGTVCLLPYRAPGDQSLAELIRALKGRYRAVLLANHGPVVCDKDITAAVYAAEELEETAKLLLLLRPFEKRILDQSDADKLRDRYGGGV